MYDLKTYKEPFWAESGGFMTGRDPLGIQNSSVALYGSLLPGMTNLTLRLRYYGFYCWLLNEYRKLELPNVEKTLQHHHNFIRRAELVISFLMVNKYPDYTSIVGRIYADNHNQKLLEQGYFNIAKGADKHKDTEKKTVYWDYPSGALGQYYAGSLMAMGLIEISDKFFLILEKGKELAMAFESRLDSKQKQTFLGILESKRMEYKDLDHLVYFAINNIQQGSEEWNYYKSLLLDNDGPKTITSENIIPTNRRATIRLFLQFKAENKANWFPQQQFQKNHEGTLNIDTSFGWYYYYLNETIHFCFETIFWGMLMYLEGKSLPVYDYISQISEVIIGAIKTSDDAIDLNHTFKDFKKSIPATGIPEDLKGLQNLTNSANRYHSAMGIAFKLLFQTLTLAEKRIDRIKSFENKYSLVHQKGHISEYFESYFYKHEELSMNEYLKLFIQSIINDHISTAYRKMGNGEANLVKFEIEDGIIGHIQTMEPKFTTPRLITLGNYLTDLGFINAQGEITPAGYDLIKEISAND